ncbi:hypothetical protein [Chryseobacterium sp. HSC-36S06]|uniref:hypothetical protein n=1 Tax=Chryseobacterium sp. HSC-36S06 TaxID=2910970 RepID=UPI00209F0D7D|nr:hypothetical protein [Chryseobacterium sp. HSC-36S06]MCP2039063.1 hypothetical protein [Chryseobacterium sp. HSC-36S06]
MNPKILPALVSMVVSFIILTILSFFMTKFLLNSDQDFMTFFEEKWLITLSVVVVFVGYKNFFSKRK